MVKFTLVIWNLLFLYLDIKWQIKKYHDKLREREKLQKEKAYILVPLMALLFFLLFEQRVLQFHFSLGITNYVAGTDCFRIQTK